MLNKTNSKKYGTLIKLRKEYHKILIDYPDKQSWASYILLKNLYKIKEKKETDSVVPEWRIWLTFRNKYLKKQLRLHKGNLVCAYCGSEYLDPNMNNPFRKKFRKAATVDHIKAVSKKGSRYDELNMCVCCNKCNNKKSDKDVNIFLKKDIVGAPNQN